MTLTDRVKEYCDYKNIAKSTFERKAGVANGYFKEATLRISPQKIMGIHRAFPDLNIEWLQTGNGEMLKTEQTEVPAPFKHDENNIVPVVPIYAMGGSLTGFDASISMADCEKMISPISEAEMAIGVYGDSMAPEFPSGSRVLIKRIDMEAFIEWGKTYVLATTNGSIVKVVYPSGADAIECRSINPDYPPFKVRYKDIHAMYRVLMCMAMK